uniref:PASTA domain-containing protein n=1 Tax=Mycobacterium sp. (strain JLS) TaxID=164757 RepID=A0A5Q5CL93_MYCSJ
MKMTTLATTALAGIATFMIAAAQPAAAAPTGPDSVQDTVSRLESKGYKVILNKVGSAPLEQCTVSGVRPGRDVTEFRQNRRDQLVERVLYTTVYVDASC